MKKLILILSGLFFTSLAFAQKDPKATSILDDVSQKYQSMRSFNVAFTFGAEGSNAKLIESTKGNVTVKGNKFHLKMAGQAVFTNGKDLYTYVKETNEVNITEYDPSTDEALSPTGILNLYKKGYKYVYAGETKEGAQVYDNIELTPESKSGNIAKIQMKVDRKDKSLKSWKIWDKSGKRTVFRVDKFVPNAPADEKLFTFDKKLYPGAEVVDLR